MKTRLPAGTRIVSATNESLPAIAALAGVIWRACYPGMITEAQIEYMLRRMYSLDVLNAELRQGIRFEQLMVGGRLGGFASWGPTEQPGEFKLHKLYLHPDWHGLGLGSRLLKHCEREACRRGANRLVLTVNKRNTRALAAYERNGFRKADAVVIDIGGGFVMDDYVLEKELPPARRGRNG